jgi:hypothetical protein
MWNNLISTHRLFTTHNLVGLHSSMRHMELQNDVN